MKGCSRYLACVFLLFIVVFIIVIFSDNDTDDNSVKEIDDANWKLSEKTERSMTAERESAISVKRKLENVLVKIEVQSRKLKAAGYSQKEIDDANWKLLEKTERSMTAAEKRIFYKSVNKVFPSYRKERPMTRRTTYDPDLTVDEKRFFWATLNVEGIVMAPKIEIKWAVLWLADNKFSDADFKALQRRMQLYKSFIIENPEKASPPSWAVGKY